MNYLVVIVLALTAVVVVSVIRTRRDRELLADEVRRRGGEVIRLIRARRGSPFPDTGRGWWAWKVEWRDAGGERTSWALTTRDGLGEWRD
ncbi:hypothetical protein [Symbiobacterium thermophilum]|jgi:type II secretory pathway pseudopilin PulG|uniref:Uncharacterized protein n=2 Tax=Symbiobacterium thermophilum TaxID=2734 RepID=Q67P00_SYMTH|nr:hypothetical protein [Symbiobacterium thermophilum]MBY6276485.1 hypothetical protein [Symbiobacterium thermophilum]BAD40593.1 hypothetical protein STH1608 [Symbiobacterium thermophilum IAM 14863]